jgi:hypothetical protein
LSQQQQISQVYKLNQFIYDHKNRIFQTHTATFQTIMFVLGQTHAWGQKREDNTIVLLKKQFGEKNVKPIGKLGSTEDMVGGIDTVIVPYPFYSKYMPKWYMVHDHLIIAYIAYTTFDILYNSKVSKSVAKPPEKINKFDKK